MRSRLAAVLLLGVLASIGANCGNNDDFVPIDGNPALPSGGGGAVLLGTQSVANGLNSPVFTTAPRNDSRLFILEQAGTIRIVADGVLLAELFLDISDLVGCCGERGLLGLAFPVDYAASGLFYINYNNDDDKNANIT